MLGVSPASSPVEQETPRTFHVHFTARNKFWAWTTRVSPEGPIKGALASASMAPPKAALVAWLASAVLLPAAANVFTTADGKHSVQSCGSTCPRPSDYCRLKTGSDPDVYFCQGWAPGTSTLLVKSTPGEIDQASGPECLVGLERCNPWREASASPAGEACRQAWARGHVMWSGDVLPDRPSTPQPSTAAAAPRAPRPQPRAGAACTPGATTAPPGIPCVRATHPLRAHRVLLG